MRSDETKREPRGAAIVGVPPHRPRVGRHTPPCHVFFPCARHEPPGVASALGRVTERWEPSAASGPPPPWRPRQRACWPPCCACGRRRMPPTWRPRSPSAAAPSIAWASHTRSVPTHVAAPCAARSPCGTLLHAGVVCARATPLAAVLSLLCYTLTTPTTHQLSAPTAWVAANQTVFPLALNETCSSSGASTPAVADATQLSQVAHTLHCCGHHLPFSCSQRPVFASLLLRLRR